MPIIARMTSDEYNIMNNEMFMIKKVSEEWITMTSSENDSIACMSIPTSEFTKHFSIGFAITIHCAQGQSYNHPYTIHEFSRLDNRLRYVALSRSTKRDFINVI